MRRRQGGSRDPEHAKAIEEAFAKGGERQVQRMELARALENAKKASDEKKYFSPLWLAYAQARAEDNELAIKWLETVYAEHWPRLVRLLMERDLLVGLHAVSGIGEAGGVETA